MLWSLSYSSNDSCTINLSGKKKCTRTRSLCRRVGWMLSHVTKHRRRSPSCVVSCAMLCNYVAYASLFSGFHASFMPLVFNQTLHQPMGRSRLRFRPCKAFVCIKPMRDQHTSVSTDVLPKCSTQSRPHPVLSVDLCPRHKTLITLPPTLLRFEPSSEVIPVELPSVPIGATSGHFAFCPQARNTWASVRKELAGASESEMSMRPGAEQGYCCPFW